MSISDEEFTKCIELIFILFGVSILAFIIIIILFKQHKALKIENVKFQIIAEESPLKWRELYKENNKRRTSKFWD